MNRDEKNKLVTNATNAVDKTAKQDSAKLLNKTNEQEVKKVSVDVETEDTNVESFEVPAEYLTFTFDSLSPLDGRYANIQHELAPYFSEYALVNARIGVEIHWLLFLLNMCDKQLPDASIKEQDQIEKIYTEFSIESFLRVKEIEKKTKHDVKACELFVAEELRKLGLDRLVSFVHFGCTSEDITNVAYASMIDGAIEEVWIPAAYELISVLSEIALENSNVAMLAHTHGQPATPTTVGKELTVFVYRMRKSIEHLESIDICAKFNGATGNYSAFSVAFPNADVPYLSREFISRYLGYKFNPVTTQIESHDYFCHIADAIRHFNNVLLDLDRDMWMYISKEYFKQIPVATEVGSSTMPHKVNPINFENSESNIDMSNTIFMALSNKLPVSRMQRDLSDSSSQRNIGLAFGHSLQAIYETIKGLKKVAVNTEKISADLDNKWEVLAEPIQTMLRKYGVPDAYDQLKELTRGKTITKEIIHEFINSLNFLNDKDKETLLNLTPATYTGFAASIVAKELA